MKGKNKPDNLEKFFQRVLGEFEEDPGEAFWDRIAPNIPTKPTAAAFVYKGWMLAMAFLVGLLLSSLFFYWQSNSQLISTLETEVVEKNKQIEFLQQKILMLEQEKASNNMADVSAIATLNTKKKEITQHRLDLNQAAFDTPKKAKSSTSINGDKESLIKLEIARKTGVVATATTIDGGWLQPRLLLPSEDISKRFLAPTTPFNKSKYQRLLFDNQLIRNSFFAGKTGDFIPEKTVEIDPVEIKGEEKLSLDLLKTNKALAIIFDQNDFELSLAEKVALFGKSQGIAPLNMEENELTSFLTGSINPFSSYKYNLVGYNPIGPVALESAGIGKSWNWSVYGGFETKSKWSVQMGIDYNKLTVVKESVNNIRFKQEDATAVNGGYVYSFNQRTDGALGHVSVSATILNQQKGDGQDILNGDLFQLSISTEQPVKIIRLPIMGGYRFDLSKRFYVTPKLGVSAVWKIKDQTQLKETKTFSERLSLQKSGIFLTTKTTTESLEANFRTEFGFRWRKKWHLIAEPRFKYGNALFQYKNLELKDSPFHLMVGIRFNVD